PTIQVVLDALKLTPFYNTFQITPNVLEIYMQEFWATVSLYHNSLRFKMNGKSHTLNVENFRDMLQICPRLPDSKACKEFYAVASGAVPPKAKMKYKKKTDEPVTSPKSKTDSASKGTRVKFKAKVTKPDMMKQPIKKTKAKGFVLLSEVALSEAEQIKLATKRSKKDFYISHVSGLGDGVDTQSKVPDEQVQKTSSIDEETGNIPGVLDVPPYESESDNESWGDSEMMRVLMMMMVIMMMTLRVMIMMILVMMKEHNLTEKIDDEETMDDEEDDEVLKELYEDVNVNLEKGDAKMTDANQRGSEQQNISQESRFDQEEEDAHVDSTMKKIIKDQVKEQVSKMMPKIKKYVTGNLGAKVLVRTTNQPQTAYVVAASLSEFELKKILIDKMKANKSINKSDIQKNLYNALVESYNSDKDIIRSYGDVFLLKRGRDDQDKDEDPFTGSVRGTRRRKYGKDTESSKGSRSKEKKSSSTSKDASESQHKSFGKSYDLNVALRTFTRRIVSQRWVEDLQLGVESYQKKLNLTKPDTFKLNLKNKTAYTSNSNPHGITYVDSFKRKRLMRIDELHKFSDGTLNDVQTALHDIVARIRMEYLPMRK
nr:hypothetical protein [Tanacetum cinerariifolium]